MDLTVEALVDLTVEALVDALEDATADVITDALADALIDALTGMVVDCEQVTCENESQSSRVAWPIPSAATRVGAQHGSGQQACGVLDGTRWLGSGSGRVPHPPTKAIGRSLQIVLHLLNFVRCTLVDNDPAAEDPTAQLIATDSLLAAERRPEFVPRWRTQRCSRALHGRPSRSAQARQMLTPPLRWPRAPRRCRASRRRAHCSATNGLTSQSAPGRKGAHVSSVVPMPC